jgi:hypothetical protein
MCDGVIIAREQKSSECKRADAEKLNASTAEALRALRNAKSI